LAITDLLERCPDGHLSDTVQPQSGDANSSACHRVTRRIAAEVPARPIHIGPNVWIGFDVCVLPGVTIGEGSIVGARSVVASDVAPYSVVAGNPARFIRHLDKQEITMVREKLSGKDHCLRDPLLVSPGWRFLRYLIGLRRLGYDPCTIEDSGRWIWTPDQRHFGRRNGNISAVVPILEAHGFADRWAFRGNHPDGQCYGMAEDQILRLYREADAFLNVTGAQEIREEHLAPTPYVESRIRSPPRCGHHRAMVVAALAVHDSLLRREPGCARLPRTGGALHWLPTRQPVVLDLWNNPTTLVL